jgi:D-alanyl-D-alanine carboxypeptidase
MLDILLGALSATLNNWAGMRENVIMLEGHGREELLKEIDVSRTMGWFTAFYPLILEVPESNDILDFINKAARIRQSIPNHGVGYGILRYITDYSKSADVVWNVAPEISFNYHGKTDMRGDQILFQLMSDKYGHDISPESERDFQLDFVSSINDGRLELSLVYNAKAYLPQTMDRLVEIYKKKLLEMVKLYKKKRKAEKQFFNNKLSELLCKYNAAGLIVGIASDNGKVNIHTVGKADIQDNVEMNKDTSFIIGSITKTFIATVVLQLAEDELLDLNKSINDYIPEVVKKYSYKNLKTVTIRNLLNHTSGINEFTNNKEFLDIFFSDESRVWKPEELLTYAFTENGKIFPGGKPWIYSSTNYILLGMIIESITKMSVKDNIQTRICNKLGLKNTMLLDSLSGISNLSHCYVGSEKKDLTNLNFTALWAAGGMISNAKDLLVWLTALTEGKLLKDKKAMFDFTDVSDYYDQQKVGIGLGLFNVNGMVGHEGNGPGFQNILYRHMGYNFVIHINREKSNEMSIASDAYEIFVEIINCII